MLLVTSACSLHYHSLTSQVDLINTEEIDMINLEFYANFVDCIITILSQRLVLQAHYNDTSPDLSNVLQKQSWQVLLHCTT